MPSFDPFTPILTLVEVAAVVRAPTVNVQQWVTRDNFRPVTPAPGRGKTRFFAPCDVLAINAIAELGRLGIPPSMAGPAAEFIATIAVQRIGELQGVWGDIPPETEDLHRWIMVQHEPGLEELEWSQLPGREGIDFQGSSDSAGIIIDAFGMVDKVMIRIGEVLRQRSSPADPERRDDSAAPLDGAPRKEVA